MRLLLLGTGYVGMALLQGWGDPSMTFWATTTTESKLELLQSHAERAFLVKNSDTKTLKEAIDGCDGMVITIAPGQGASYKETYLETAHTVSAILKERKKPFYLIYTGSTSVYGDHGGEQVDESAELHLESENAKILAETEEVYLSCGSKVVTPCILRLGGIYGPGRDMAERAKRMAGRELGGTGEEPTNNIHRDDVVEAIKFCVGHQCEGIYNVVSGDHRSRKELYEGVCGLLGIPLPIWCPEKTSLHGSNCRVSSQKLRERGFNFQYPSVKINVGASS